MNNIDLAIEDFVNKTLNLEGLTLKGFEKLAISNGFYFKQQGGDENHGTYAIFKTYNAYSAAITKCHCGHIHRLEDMCIKCHPVNENLKTLNIKFPTTCSLCEFSEYMEIQVEPQNTGYLWSGKVKCPNCSNTGDLLYSDGNAFINWAIDLPF
ncbi:UNVERIFIED_CONTAM: hypothetical protein KWE62_03310 [Acinetobacter baumannii]|uniref:hypothetical protein n=1 Tax=Acinetobacter TaxID=469 RepID=UPI00028B33B3|nr:MULTISPECIES: hypothetical protein [Acinetobacter]AFU39013.1 primosomal protein N` [Acinetobacter baumannii TYTH-1]AZC04803.1 hypothetical protein DKE50_014825 [Acinetobacter nosocomialis]AZC06533.1 hypothetical protein DKE44_014405 [Acinetobacter nosocomialis]EHU1962724.1 hypothetical protein [Acinetobacter baumannii]EHU2349666.1 hypothetical protein [Acinetobacter baumannii]